jgi:glycerophosphoryl diester phosphodiesterase
MDAIHHLKGFLLMNINFWIEKCLHQGVDLFYEKMPQSFPDTEKLEQCKIISHRGEHDNKMVYENTIPAFDRVNEASVCGIEFHIRWTKDLKPVVFHDRDLQRVFKSDSGNVFKMLKYYETF